MVEVDAREDYRRAWEAWRRQLEELHRVLLDGERLGPAQMKGLLNREARAKEAYERAREALLGIGKGRSLPTPGGGNPFREA